MTKKIIAIHFRRVTSVADVLEQLPAPCGAKGVSAIGTEEWDQVTCAKCLESKPEEKKEKTVTKTAKSYTVRDLSAKLSLDGKKIRALLRSNEIAKSGKSYEWNGKEFAIIARKLSKLIAA